MKKALTIKGNDKMDVPDNTDLKSERLGTHIK